MTTFTPSLLIFPPHSPRLLPPTSRILLSYLIIWCCSCISRHSCYTRDHTGCILSRWQCLAHLSLPSSSQYLLSPLHWYFLCLGVGGADGPFRAEQLTVTYPQHLEELCISMLTILYCKKKLIWPSLRTMLV